MDSFIPWIGGKRLLRKEICSRFPNNFEKYVEVFGGAAWVLFYKDKHADFEIYNDVNNNLVNLFRCVKHHPNAVFEELDWILNSRDIFNDFKELCSCSSLTDIQRAVKYFYLIKTSYGANVKNFAAKSRNITYIKNLKEIKERLKNVVIENKSYDKLIKQYDKPISLFYCDPPYYNSEKYYDIGEVTFTEGDHIKLNEILKNIKGRCIISYNDTQFIRDLYKDFNIEGIERQNNLTMRYGNKSYKELIIKNY